MIRLESHMAQYKQQENQLPPKGWILPAQLQHNKRVLSIK